jgi:preprotein translocase subunit SecG
LTRATSILGALFLVLSLGLALVHRTPGGRGVEAAGRQQSANQDTDWGLDSGGTAPAEE